MPYLEMEFKAKEQSRRIGVRMNKRKKNNDKICIHKLFEICLKRVTKHSCIDLRFTENFINRKISTTNYKSKNTSQLVCIICKHFFLPFLFSFPSQSKVSICWPVFMKNFTKRDSNLGSEDLRQEVVENTQDQVLKTVTVVENSELQKQSLKNHNVLFCRI